MKKTMKKELEIRQIELSNYHITSNGKVFSTTTGRFIELKPTKIRSGYNLITIYLEGKKKNCLVHRLVCEYFGEGYNDKLQCNHKDLNKQNNDISNLEMLTPKQNVNHYLLSKNIQPYKLKVINKNGNYTIFNTFEEVKDHCGYKSRSSVLSVLNGCYKSKKGYTFERVYN